MALRAELETLIAKDLLGPAGADDEELARELNSPRDRYLLGMLAPKTQRLRASQMDLLGEGGDGGGEDGKDDEAGLPTDSLMPNSIGLTATAAGEAKALTLTARWGRPHPPPAAAERLQRHAARASTPALVARWRSWPYRS